MKFHYSVGPNPRIVRMFMEERGIELPTREVDIINTLPETFSPCAG